MKSVEGDLIKLALAGEFDVIVHGCNCMCQMGAGIAQTIQQVFPEAYAADCQTAEGDRTKLGTCSVGECNRDGNVITVVNVYTQYHWQGEGVLADYSAIRSCMQWIKENYSGKRIGLPKIGAGLAKGNWETISNLIEETLSGEDVTLVIFKRD